MKLHPLFVAGGLILALAACRPGAAEYTETESSKQLTLDKASGQVDVRFVPRSSRLVAADAGRLRALAESGQIALTDRLIVTLGGSPALAPARLDAISSVLMPYGIAVNQSPQMAGSALAPDRAVIATERYLVTLPPCPNWSKEATVRFSNTDASNFGCATAVNLGLSVARPADLAEGTPVGLADGRTAAAAVNRYLNDKVQLPTATALGPIAASAPAAVAQSTAGAEP